MSHNHNMQETSMRDFYAGKHVLITGSTGFMGKVLVEKILRSFPEVAAVYLIIRPKKGQVAHERLSDFTKAPLFEQVRMQKEGAIQLSKLTAINGDLIKPNMNLSTDDMQMLQDNVNIIFHMAATVHFDQSLKSALAHNTGGTFAMLQLAETCKHLQAFVYVSTAYCHCDQKILEEIVYPAPHDPRKILDLVSWLDDDLVRLLTPGLLKDAPNTYSYTKCLSEQLVSEYAERLPVAIVRPSIVMGTVQDPLPGWTDNFNGPVGVLVSVGKGVTRSLYGNQNLKADLVPVDMTIRGLLLVSKETHQRTYDVKEKCPLVVNLASDEENQITWGDMINLGTKHYFKYPYSRSLWYPRVSMKSSYFLHMLCVIFFHIIPAYFIDFMMILTRNKLFLVRTQKRIRRCLQIFEYYTLRPWHFRNEKIKQLTAQLSEEEKEIFGIDCSGIDWDQYMHDIIIGIRKYCMKESPQTIPRAKKILKILHFLDLLANIMGSLILLCTAWFFSPAIIDITLSIVGYLD